MKDLPFFKERGLKDQAISDTLRLMHYKESNKGDVVIEYGTFGDEFYVLLDGECEVLVPDQHQIDSFKQVNLEMRVMREQLEARVKEYEAFAAYKQQLEVRKQMEEQAAKESAFAVESHRRYTTVIAHEIPQALRARFRQCEELVDAIKRFYWRKNYELSTPILKLGPGNSFGELAVQKEVNVKIAHKAKARAASVTCLTPCKFLVMQKKDYQRVLDNIDRRKVDKLKAFFRQIPFLKALPRSTL